VELPFSPVADRRRHPRLPPDLAALRDVRVLVVDDQEDERALLSTIFETQGAQVRAAASVAAAFETVIEWPPDVIVSDLAMPAEDGYALIRRVRQAPHLQDVPVIAVTAHARPDDRAAALRAGFHAYVPKPLDRDYLLGRAADLVMRRARRSDV
jgi:CheY-like chemotaxis protein